MSHINFEPSRGTYANIEYAGNDGIDKPSCRDNQRSTVSGILGKNYGKPSYNLVISRHAASLESMCAMVAYEINHRRISTRHLRKQRRCARGVISAHFRRSRNLEGHACFS